MVGNVWQENNIWYGYWVCNECTNEIKCHASKKYYLLRNLKKKNTCKKCSLKKQVGEGNPFYNKKHTSETINQISKTRTGKGCGNSNAMANPEFKAKAKKNLNEAWTSGKLDYVRKILSDSMIKTRKEGKIKSIIRSKAEDELIGILKENNINSSPNHKIESKIFDIFIPQYNLLIEYNGDYWHCNPNKFKSDYFNVKKQQIAKELWEYDEKKLHLAKNNGYNYEVIWESDYKKNKNIIIELINKKYANK